MKTVYTQFDINGDYSSDLTTSDSIDFVEASVTNNVCIGGHCADITLRIVSSGQSYCEVGNSLDL